MRLALFRLLVLLLLALLLTGCPTSEQVKEAIVKSGQRLEIIDQAFNALFQIPQAMPIPPHTLYALAVNRSTVNQLGKFC